MVSGFRIQGFRGLFSGLRGLGFRGSGGLGFRSLEFGCSGI